MAHNDEIKHCPFCDGEAFALRVPDDYAEGWAWYRVACTSCLIGTSRIAGRDNAIEHWNRRINELDSLVEGVA